MYARGRLSLVIANGDTRLTRGPSLFEKSLDFWRDLTRRLYGRDNDFANFFAQGERFELLGPCL